MSIVVEKKLYGGGAKFGFLPGAQLVLAYALARC